LADCGTQRGLVGLGVLDSGLESAVAATARGAAAVVVGTLGVATTTAVDVLLEPLVLIGLRLVRDVRRSSGRRVLLADGRPNRELVGPGVLDSGLESTRTTAAGVTAGGATDVLGQVLVLIR